MIKGTKETPILVDIFGSCVSRGIFLLGDMEQRGCVDERIRINHYFDKHPILSCVTPGFRENDPILNPEIVKRDISAIVQKIPQQPKYWGIRHDYKHMEQELLKTTIDKLKTSDADYFVLDLYSMHLCLCAYANTFFFPYNGLFFYLNCYEKNPDQFRNFFFPLNFPKVIWCGYVQQFLNIVFTKYKPSQVILVRFQATGHYITKQNTIAPIPPECTRAIESNVKFNQQVRELEDEIISMYHPHVLDLTKYYIGNAHEWDNLQGAHYTKLFYKEGFKQMQNILFRPDEDEILTIAHPSFEGISRILRQDLPQETFEQMWDMIANPIKNSSEILPLQRLSLLSKQEVIEHRLVLSNIYEIANSIEYILLNDCFCSHEKDWLLHCELKRYIPNTAYDAKLVETMFVGVDCSCPCGKLEDFQSVFEKFLYLFEHDNVQWIPYLKRAEDLQPNNREVLKYRLFYAKALDDMEQIAYYEEKLKQPNL